LWSCVDGLLSGGLKFLGDFLHVFQPTSVLFFSFSATSSESTPPPFLLYCVINGLLHGDLKLLSVFPCVFLASFGVVPFPWCHF
jgi:hypothetical protein